MPRRAADAFEFVDAVCDELAARNDPPFPGDWTAALEILCSALDARDEAEDPDKLHADCWTDDQYAELRTERDNLRADLDAERITQAAAVAPGELAAAVAAATTGAADLAEALRRPGRFSKADRTDLAARADRIADAFKSITRPPDPEDALDRPTPHP